MVIRENTIKCKLRQDYQLASMIVALFGASISGKNPPSLYKMYPDLFAYEAEEEAYINFRNALLSKVKKED